MFNIAVIGEAATGKSAFLLSHLTGQFVISNTEPINTVIEFETEIGFIGLNFIEETIDVENIATSGCHIIGTTTDTVFVFFNKFATTGVENASKIVKHIRTILPQVPIVLIGSKSDIGGEYANQMYNDIFFLVDSTNNIEFYDVSARSSYNKDRPIQHVLHKLLGKEARLVYEKHYCLDPKDQELYDTLEAEFATSVAASGTDDDPMSTLI